MDEVRAKINLDLINTLAERNGSSPSASPSPYFTSPPTITSKSCSIPLCPSCPPSSDLNQTQSHSIAELERVEGTRNALRRMAKENLERMATLEERHGSSYVLSFGGIPFQVVEASIRSR